MPKPFRDGQLVDVDVDVLVLGAQLIRHDPNDEDIIELAASITEQGLLEPGGFTILADGTHQLLYGSRRLAAFKRLKRRWIPCIFKAAPESSIKTIAIVENLQRRQLSLAEEVDAITHLHFTEEISIDQIAVRLSKSRDWVLRRLAIPELPPDLQTPLLEGRLNLGQIEELNKIDHPGLRQYAAAQAEQQRLSKHQCGELVLALSSAPENAEAVETAVMNARARQNDGPPHLDCQACGTDRPVNQLRVIRVCAAGCPTPPPPNTEPELPFTSGGHLHG